MAERIDNFENDLNTMRDKCSTSDADKLASFTLDNTESVRWNHFDIAAELNDNKVEIFIRDTNTKSIYHNNFDANELQTCGFSNVEVLNLDVLSKFITNAAGGTLDDARFSIVVNTGSLLMKIIETDKNFGTEKFKLKL